MNFLSEIRNYPHFVEAIEFIFETNIDDLNHIASYTFNYEQIPIEMKHDFPVVLYTDLYNFSLYVWTLHLCDSLGQSVCLSVIIHKPREMVIEPYYAYRILIGVDKTFTGDFPIVRETRSGIAYILRSCDHEMIRQAVTIVPLYVLFEICDNENLVEPKAIVLRLYRELNESKSSHVFEL